MESSKMFGGTEECHSSESGWTMYIGSLIHDDDDDGSSSDARAHDTAEGDGGGGDDDDDDSDANDDDSMASDASSGPSHEMVRLKHGEDDEGDDGKSYSYMDNKKANKPMKKKLVGRNNKSPKKNDKGDIAGSSAAPSQSGSKVRKSFWHPKRK